MFIWPSLEEQLEWPSLTKPTVGGISFLILVVIPFTFALATWFSPPNSNNVNRDQTIEIQYTPEPTVAPPSSTSTSVERSNSFNKVQSLLKKACDGEQNCILHILSLTKFIWDNHGELNPTALGYKLSKCVAISASKRGYLFAPLKFLEEMGAKELKSVSSELCSCSLGYWAKDVCLKIVL
ncbi:hypothetical protein [Ahrensia marina]|uniref:hypothetical protein n=1 Tax=Ahrensia marina TaxID=1514904 RepID=UPI000AD2E3E3|nr:hypothetical protein [Ahrensia marina]